jgi:hypothetical protein
MMTDATTRAPGPSPAPQTAGPIAAVAYLCADDGDPVSTGLYTAWCEQRAAADRWTLTEVVTDPDDLTPLIERSGWQRVTGLLVDGRVGAVITVNRRMVADNAAAWVRLTDLLHGLGAVLVTSNSAPVGASCQALGGAS